MDEISDFKIADVRLTRQRTARSFEPFTSVKLMVFARMNAFDYSTQTMRPFSAIMRAIQGFRGEWQNQRVTVTGVLMPSVADINGDPVLQYVPCDRWMVNNTRKDIESALRERLRGMDEAELIRFAEETLTA